MLPVTSKELKEIMREKATKGEDIKKIKVVLKNLKNRKTSLAGFKEVQMGKYIYSSTGPINKEDFR